jgi:hypothetical protein
MAKDDTIDTRPMPKRPENGLLAWQATIGYISSQYSLDAMLTAQAAPLDDGRVAWSASASWGRSRESVEGLPSLPTALRELWREVDRNHVIFETRTALIKRPANYAENEWLDADTAAVLDRLVHVTGAVYNDDWQIVLVYQPVESLTSRFQARLLARGGAVQIGAHGASLRDACHTLYRNAAPHYAAHSGKSMADLS